MLKSELIYRIQRKTNDTCYPALNEDQIMAFLNAFCAVCHEAMLDEDRVILSGLGTFGSKRMIVHSDADPNHPDEDDLQVLRPYFKFSKNAEKLLKDASINLLNPSDPATYTDKNLQEICGNKETA